MSSLSKSVNFIKIKIFRSKSLTTTTISICIFFLIFYNLFSLENESSVLGKSKKVTPMRNNILPDSSNYAADDFDKVSTSSDLNIKDNSNLVKEIVKRLIDFSPSNEIVKSHGDQMVFKQDVDSPKNDIYSHKYLTYLATIPHNLIKEAKKKHSQLIKYLKQNVPSMEMKFSQNNGAVIIGGSENDLTWLALISTRLFRKSGGALPVEVILPSYNDYLKDKEICDKYLPQLNAKCVVLSDLLNFESNEKDIENYIKTNFKLMERELAILLSSFENVLFLTPENIMLKPLENTLFKQPLFRENGLFIWNDFGARKTLPTFYELTGTNVEFSKVTENGLPLPESRLKKLPRFSESELKSKVSYHDFKNTLPFHQNDASELIISKLMHLDTLILSLYYNMNGPKIYYPLLSGAPHGNGRKETVIAAAHVLANPYYVIKTSVDSDGFWYDNKYHGTSMVQFDPTIDSYSYDEYISKFDKKEDNDLSWEHYQTWLKESNERRSALFLNVNNPSLKPVELFNKDIVRKQNGDRIRIISNSPIFDKDFEITIWRIMNDYMCHLNIDCNYLSSRSIEKQNRDELCEVMREHLVWLSNQ